MDTDRDSPIFIVGTPRSGTTLTARILGRHSRLFMPGETHFFDDVHARRHQLGDPSEPAGIASINERLATLYGRFNEPDDQRRVERLFASDAALRSPCRDYGDVLARFMAAQARAAGKVRWGNQTPRDIFNVKAIEQLFPQARFIVCVRDIRDFLVSYRDKVKVAVTAGQAQRAARLYHPVVTSLLWSSTMGRIDWIERHVAPDRFLLLRYEDLATRPECTVRRVCDFLGEAFEPEMLAVEGSNSSVPGQRDRRGVFSSSVGRWRTALAPEEAWVAQTIGGRRFRALGYRSERQPVRLWRLAWVLLTAPRALRRALEANRHLRGPLLPYLARRLVRVPPWERLVRRP